MAIISQRQNVWDGLAIGASMLCLVHCLLLPVLIVLLPSLAAFLALPEEVHYWALAFAIPTSIAALVAGFRGHGSLRPALIVAPGLVLLALGVFMAPSETAETLLTVLGALLLAIGHALNWRALRHNRISERGGAEA